MKKITFIIVLSFITLSFCVSKVLKQNNEYKIAYIKEITIYNIDNNKEKNTNNFIGVFPKKNDSIKIFQIKENGFEELNKYVFWSEKDIKNSTIIFYNSENEKVNVVFKNFKIYVDNDIYEVNNSYFNYLRQKVLYEGSILDLVFFLKDGYGDYAGFFEPLNKNWRNQKENNTYRIISANIKNKDNQTDDHFFNYNFNYEYDENGVLKSIEGENRYNKKLINNKKYIQYSILDGENERSMKDFVLYKNKKTLFDSIVGSTMQYSISKSIHFTKYQSKLEYKDVDVKPKGITEIIKILEIK